MADSADYSAQNPLPNGTSDASFAGASHLSPALLRAIFSACADHLFVIDNLGMCVYACGTQETPAPFAQAATDASLPAGLASQIAREARQVFENAGTLKNTSSYPDAAGKISSFEHVLTPMLCSQGGVSAVACVVRDISDTRFVQERLRLAVDAAALGTYSFDVPPHIIEGNQTCREQFFLSPDVPFTYDLFLSLLHPDDREPICTAMERSIERRQAYNAEFRVIAPDGHVRWLNAIGRGLYDAEGKPCSFDGISIDVTARKRAEEERDIARRDADQRALELADIYEKEHRIAEALQRSLLIRPPAEALIGMEVETVYEAALDEAEVGGDYYDIFALEGGRLALVVGDVSGKGLEAASRTAEIKFTLRAYLREYPHVACAMNRMNAFLCEAQALEHFVNDYFVCLTVAIVDRAAGTLEVCAAGAEPSFLLRAGGEVEEVRAGGMPLGVYVRSEYAAVVLAFTPGDLYLMATDGLTEARREREFLGSDGLARLAKEAAGAPTLVDLGQAVLGGAQSFAGGKLHDDACLLLARCLP